MQTQPVRTGVWQIGVLFVALVLEHSGSTLAQPTPDQLFASASPAVVRLIIRDERYREIGTGSGFIVASDKLSEGMFTSTIITNYHVAYPAVSMSASFQSEESGEVNKVLVEDPYADIAGLTVLSSYKPEKVLRLCVGEAPAIGTKVFTIGSPLGLTNTLSEGLVSGYRKHDDGSPWMQISAPVSPGSSGGPVLSVEGCVVGMTTATALEGQNLNFAIPAKDILRVLDAPKKDRPVWDGACLSEPVNKVILECAYKFALQEKCVTDRGWRGECFDEAIRRKENSGDQQALLLAALGWEPKTRTDEEKGELLKRAANAPPGDFSYFVHYKRAMTILEDGMKRTLQVGDYYPQAISALVKSRDLKPDFAPTRYELGFRQYTHAQQQYPEALLEADAVVRLVPRCPKGYMLRGVVWAKLGRREKFELDFEKAIELRPKDYTVHEWKASGYDDLGDMDRAIEVNRRAIELADSEFSAARLNIINQLATVGQCEDAFEHFQKARLGELTPDNPYALQILKCRARANRVP